MITEDSVLLKSMKFYRTGAALSLVAFLASGCAIQTATYGTGETVEAGLVRDLASLATFGAVGKKKAERITYRERAALVVPNDQQFASIPAPVDSVESVGENFPGRAAEIQAEKDRDQRKANNTIINNALGVSRAQPLTTSLKKNEKEAAAADLDTQRINASIGVAVPQDARDLTKTPEDHARERGVTVEELPEALRDPSKNDRSLLARAGLTKPKTTRRSQSLTDVPVEYRTVQQDPNDPEVNQLLTPKKKKKKFLFF